MNRSLTEKITDLVAIGLFLIACVPLLVLSFHNHPSAADDYCFADTATKFGFWQAQKFYYDGWTGRYFSNFLVHGNPLVLGWYDGFRIIPALITIAWVASGYALVSELLLGQSARSKIVVTALLFFLFILALQSTVEAFFWTAAIASYTVPTALTFYLLAVILRWYRLPVGTLRILTAVWAGVLVFAIVGSSETNMVILFLLLGAILGYRLLFQRTLDWFLVFLVLSTLLSTYLLFRAPGNAIRMSGNKMGGNFSLSFVSSFAFLAKLIVTWLLTTPVLPLSALFLPLAVRLVSAYSPTRTLFMIPVWVAISLLIGLLAAMIFPSYFGVGIPPVYRVTNVVYAFFLIGWFYTLTVWVSLAVRRGWLTGQSLRLPAWVLLIAALWIGGGLFFSTSLRGMYTDWLHGDAARYDAAMTKRHQQLVTSADTLHVQPVGVYPPTLFVEDIRENPAFLWNHCQAGYYGHKSVILDPTPNR